MLHGFLGIVKRSVEIGTEVFPADINSDLAENVSSQQRGRHGNDNNPLLTQCQSSINGSIILGQTCYARGGNAGVRVQPSAHNTSDEPGKSTQSPGMTLNVIRKGATPAVSTVQHLPPAGCWREKRGRASVISVMC